METDCYCYKYPHPAVTTDCVLFRYNGTQLEVLLIERRNEPCKGKWAFPGGFLEIDETVEEGVLRELKEETGIGPVPLEQLQVFSAVDRDPRERIISVAFYGLINNTGSCTPVAGDDAATVRWFATNELPPLAFDHTLILQAALEKLGIKKVVQSVQEN